MINVRDKKTLISTPMRLV